MDYICFTHGNYFKLLCENKHECLVLSLKIASQYCNSWSRFSLVYPVWQKASVYLLLRHLNSGSSGFQILKPSQECDGFSPYHVPTREFTLSKPAGVNDCQAPNERDACCGGVSCTTAWCYALARVWKIPAARWGLGENEAFGLVQNHSLLQLQVARGRFSRPPKDACRGTATPPLLLLACPRMKAALPADLPNHAGQPETLKCPLQLFWLHYKKLLHCRNASLASQVHYALTVEQLPAVSICEQLI